MQDLVQRILDTNNVEDVWNILLDRITEAGFHHALYGFTRFHTASGFGDENDYLFLTNFGPDYMQAYFHGGLYRNAPMVRWALDHSGARSWTRIAEQLEHLTEKELEVVQFNQKSGVTAGYTIAFPHLLKRSKGAIGVSMKPHVGTQDEADAIWQEHGKEIEVICGVAHLKLISLPLPKRILTKRQREVLEWVGDGKTVGDTAQILGLNKATVEKHLRLAREALGVETTAQAIMKASLHNQMFTF